MSYGDVICGTPCLCSLSFVFCGIVICGIFVIYLATCITIGTAFTIVGTADGSSMPFVIFCGLKFVLSYSLFTL
jgi:hypothetical protein